MLLAWQLAPARADILYDNSDTGGSQVYYPKSNVLEYGDEIILAGTKRVVAQFLFEYTGISRRRGMRRLASALQERRPQNGRRRRDAGNGALRQRFIRHLPWLADQGDHWPNVTVSDDVTWTFEFAACPEIARRPSRVGHARQTVGRVQLRRCLVQTEQQLAVLNFGPNPVANFAARISSDEPTSISIHREVKTAPALPPVTTIVVTWTGVSILQVADAPPGSSRIS